MENAINDAPIGAPITTSSNVYNANIKNGETVFEKIKFVAKNAISMI